MITDIVLYLIRQFIDLLVFILPTWTVWPSALLDGVNYACQSLAKLNYILPIDSLFAVLIFIIQFEVLYLTAKLVMKVFNFIRGTGSGLDI